MFSFTRKARVIRPRQTIKGHTRQVSGVVHLPGSRRRIMTCSVDGSLRLWDLESGAQIGEDWRNESKAEVWCMALSPNAKTVATGSGGDYNVILWDIETRKVIAKWTGHTNVVYTLCWSADGKRVASGSWDGTARVWDVKSGETVLTIKTGHTQVNAVMYSPDNEKIATGGNDENAVKIWDSKTGELITTLEHKYQVYNLAWTSDGKKLITAGSSILIRIFNTATWEQIASLEGHAHLVKALSLSQNNRLLASASFDGSARLWNLDTNLQIGPPLWHGDPLESAALSADRKVLVTGRMNGNVHTWDIHAIIKKAGLEDLLLPIFYVPSSTTRYATRRPAIPARRIPPIFFYGAQSSAAHSSSIHDPRRAPSSNPRALFSGFSSLFRHSRSKTDEATELQQLPSRTIFSRGPHIVDVPAVQDRKPLVVAPRPRPQQQSQLHGQTQASSSQTQPTTASTSATSLAPGTHATTAGVAAAQPPPIRWWARLVLFLCRASPPHANGH